MILVDDSVVHHNVSPLGARDILEVARRYLGVARLEPTMAAQVVKLSMGLPFYALEIAAAAAAAAAAAISSA